MSAVQDFFGSAQAAAGLKAADTMGGQVGNAVADVRRENASVQLIKCARFKVGLGRSSCAGNMCTVRPGGGCASRGRVWKGTEMYMCGGGLIDGRKRES